MAMSAGARPRNPRSRAAVCPPLLPLQARRSGRGTALGASVDTGQSSARWHACQVNTETPRDPALLRAPHNATVWAAHCASTAFLAPSRRPRKWRAKIVRPATAPVSKDRFESARKSRSYQALRTAHDSRAPGLNSSSTSKNGYFEKKATSSRRSSRHTGTRERVPTRRARAGVPGGGRSRDAHRARTRWPPSRWPIASRSNRCSARAAFQTSRARGGAASRRTPGRGTAAQRSRIAPGTRNTRSLLEVPKPPSKLLKNRLINPS